MKERTTFFGARAYPSDIQRLREIHQQLQGQYPDHNVHMADVLRLATQSASAVLAAGTPVALSIPRPPLPGDRAP